MHTLLFLRLSYKVWHMNHFDSAILFYFKNCRHYSTFLVFQNNFVQTLLGFNFKIKWWYGNVNTTVVFQSDTLSRNDIFVGDKVTIWEVFGENNVLKSCRHRIFQSPESLRPKGQTPFPMRQFVADQGMIERLQTLPARGVPCSVAWLAACFRRIGIPVPDWVQRSTCPFR